MSERTVGPRRDSVARRTCGAAGTRMVAGSEAGGTVSACSPSVRAVGCCRQFGRRRERPTTAPRTRGTGRRTAERTGRAGRVRSSRGSRHRRSRRGDRTVQERSYPIRSAERWLGLTPPAEHTIYIKDDIMRYKTYTTENTLWPRGARVRSIAVDGLIGVLRQGSPDPRVTDSSPTSRDRGRRQTPKGGQGDGC